MKGNQSGEGEGGRVFGQEFAGLNGAKTVADVVALFVDQAKAGIDYVAINAFLPRNARTTSKLQKVRTVIQVRTGCATTLGFGPRFLHSTGQLHKGGTNNGVFIQLTQIPPLITISLTRGLALRLWNGPRRWVTWKHYAAVEGGSSGFI